MVSDRFVEDGAAPSPARSTHTPPYAVSLTAVGADDLELAGGKGANLGELVRAGFPVPHGFVVTTDAYQLAVDDGEVGARIPTLLGESDDGAAIREAIEAAPVPAAVESAVRAAYDELGGGPVAVRSSATAEDLPGAAFAGQQDTYLGIVGADEVVDAVRRCWASLWTDRAVAYRRRQDVDQLGARIAVVVQRMVPARAAGVMFTANPVSGNRDEVVVDASTGLGEAVVSGLVTPDHFVLAKADGRIRERTLGRREVVIRADDGGGTSHETADCSDATRPAVPQEVLRELADLGRRIERHFGTPEDIEWAWAGGQVSIVQARPMTAVPEPLPELTGPQRMLARTVSELFDVRPYPIDLTSWGEALLRNATAMTEMAGITMPPLEAIWVEDDNGVAMRLDPARLPLTKRVLARAPFRMLARLRRIRRHDPSRWTEDPAFDAFLSRSRALESADFAGLSWNGVLDVLREAMALTDAIADLRIKYIPPTLMPLARLRVALALLRRGDDFGALLSGVRTKTIEHNEELAALAERVRSEAFLRRVFEENPPGKVLELLSAEPAGREFLERFQSFLDWAGHRETTSAMLASQPTWKDAPEFVVGILQGLASGPSRAPSDGPAAAAEERLFGHPLLRVPRLRGGVRRALDGARSFQIIREDTHFWGTRPLPAAHRAIGELGRRLAEAGVLGEPADVFHLRLDELDLSWPIPPERAAELAALVRRRKESRSALDGVPVLDSRHLGRGEPVADALSDGLPGSAGDVEGPARIVRGSEDFGALRDGDVLVAPYTNPSWTPLFQRAAAVVVDAGSGASHAAIVAREYGIPAVMGTGDATSVLYDGQRVRVDGTRGVVLPASDPE